MFPPKSHDVIDKDETNTLALETEKNVWSTQPDIYNKIQKEDRSSDEKSGIPFQYKIVYCDNPETKDSICDESFMRYATLEECRRDQNGLQEATDRRNNPPLLRYYCRVVEIPKAFAYDSNVKNATLGLGTKGTINEVWTDRCSFDFDGKGSLLKCYPPHKKSVKLYLRHEDDLCISPKEALLYHIVMTPGDYMIFGDGKTACFTKTPTYNP